MELLFAFFCITSPKEIFDVRLKLIFKTFAGPPLPYYRAVAVLLKSDHIIFPGIVLLKLLLL